MDESQEESSTGKLTSDPSGISHGSEQLGRSFRDTVASARASSKRASVLVANDNWEPIALEPSALEHASSQQDIWEDSGALQVAAANNQISKVEQLLSKKVDVNAQDDKGRTALQAASANNYISIVKTLLSGGADVNAGDNQGCTALQAASANNSIQVIELLLRAGADINARDNQGCTALQAASANNSILVVGTLLGGGADANSQDNQGCSALQAALAKNYIHVVTLLLDAGADTNSYGDSLLCVSSKEGTSDIVELSRRKSAQEAAESQKDGKSEYAMNSDRGISQSQKMLPAVSAETKLASFFPDFREGVIPPDEQFRYRESDIQEMSRLLRQIGKINWSFMPRLYAVLRTTDQLQLLDDLISHNVTDLMFPFKAEMLPKSWDFVQKANFTITQSIVLTNAIDLEKGDSITHRHLDKAATARFQVSGLLGRGAFSQVEKVHIPPHTNTFYARKSIFRGWGDLTRYKENPKHFENELIALKHLDHRHIIKLIGSYTDPDYFCAILSPVAQCGLREFLSESPLSDVQKTLLRSFFGCLATGLAYLHTQSIVHGDISTANILIHGDNVLISDFSVSQSDWSGELDTGPWPSIPKYTAPEVEDEDCRGPFSDIWALGGVFLEMLTRIRDETPEALAKFFEYSGSKSRRFSSNLEAVALWLIVLEDADGPRDDNIPIQWIREMLQKDYDSRPTAFALQQMISAALKTAESSFCGSCCSQTLPDTADGWFNDAESVSSEVASVFSEDLSVSSASSASLPNTDRNFALEISKALLEDDEISKSMTAFIEKVLPTSHQKARMALLKAIREYAKYLQKTAQKPLETVVANFVRGRYLVIARMMEQFGREGDEGSLSASFTMEELENLIEMRVIGLEKVPDYLRELPSHFDARHGLAEDRNETVSTPADELAESDSGSDDEQSEASEEKKDPLPHIAMAKDFLLRGESYARLVSMIRGLVEKVGETEKSSKISQKLEYETLEDREKVREPADDVGAETPSELRIPQHMASLSLHDVQIMRRIQSSWSDYFKATAETYSGQAWNWWPLSARNIPLPPGKVRIQWACSCGEKTWADVSEELIPKYIESLNQNSESGNVVEATIIEKQIEIPHEALDAQNQMTPTDHSTKVGQILPKVSSPNQGTSSSPPTSTSSGTLDAVSSANTAPAAAASQAPKPPSVPSTNQNANTALTPGPSKSYSDSLNARNLYILFCVFRGRTLRYSQIEVSDDFSKHHDNKFFDDLRREYKDMRGRLRYYFDPRQFDHCDFVKFTRFDAGELARRGHELPHDSTYYYQPRPPGQHDDPPIVPHEFYRRFYYVKSTCRRNEALSRIPKRCERFQVDLHVAGREDMWGLHAEIRPFFWMVAAWMIFILAGGFVFWGWWMSRHPGDWQNASVPFTAVLGCMMLLLLPLNEKFKAPS